MIHLKSFLLFLLINISFHHSANGQFSKKFFRKDYTYLTETESFYKVHTIRKTWGEAKKKCAMEGASLFYPEDKTEADAVITFWNQTQPHFYWVYIGVSDTLAKGVFVSIDGRPVADVYNIWSPGEPNDHNGQEDCLILRREGVLNDDRCDKKYPFVCKKSLDSLEWNQNCDMPNPDYVFRSDLERCYKFHLDPKNWTEAMNVCNGEQSYLAIINSQAEADYFVNLTAEAKKDKITSYGEVYLGFHNLYSEGWETIKGTSLDEAGYAAWAPGQPDGGDREQCGSMFYSGLLNDLGCQQRCFFICEHDIESLTDSVDARFNQ